MHEYIELNAYWAKYVPLSLEMLDYDLLCERLDLGHLQTPALVDAYVADKKKEILDELQNQGFDIKYLEVLFIKDNAFLTDGEITSETDLEIVRSYEQDFGCEAANAFAKTEIDFYYLERFLRTRAHGPFPIYGRIEKERYERHFSIDSLVRNSPYFKELKGLNVRNFESKFDAYRINLMKQYQHEARGVNGIFAKVYLKLVDLQNIRIVLKGHLYGKDVSKIVRDVNA